MAAIQLLPGEVQLKDGRIQCTPLSVLMRRRRFTADIYPVGGTGNIVDGGVTDFPLPQADLLESLIVQIQCTIATNGGTYTAATFNSWPNPVPWGIIKALSLSGNGGSVNVFKLTGWDCAIYARQRTDLDIFASGTTDKFCDDAQKILGSVNPSSQTRAFAAASLAASTTYSFNLTFELPIAYNKQGEMALLKLQNNSVFTLRFEWANLIASLGAGSGNSDIITQTTVSGTAYTLTGTVRVKGKYFKYLPEDRFEYSGQTNNIKSVLSQIYAIQNGPNSIPLTRTDTYTWFGAELYNAGAPIAWSNISNIRLVHSNNEVLSQETAYTHIADRYLQHKKWPLNGFIEHDMRRRMGMPDHMDVLDAINDRNIQNLRMEFDISTSLSLSGVQGARVITEALIDAS